MTRSAAGTQKLIDAGAEPHRGDFKDLDCLRGGANRAENVIHTAFDHDLSNFVAICGACQRCL